MRLDPSIYIYIPGYGMPSYYLKLKGNMSKQECYENSNDIAD